MSAAEDTKKQVAYQFLRFLQAKKEESPETSAGVNSAIDAVSSIFGVSLSSAEDFLNYNFVSATSEDIFTAGVDALSPQHYREAVAEAEANSKYQPFLATVQKKNYFEGVEEGSLEYMQRHAKVLLKFKEKLSAKDKAAVPAKKQTQFEIEKAAEDKKNAGNNAVQKRDYNAAVRFYTEAIEILPNGTNSHIYYSNRAAAHCYLSSYELAIADCEVSVSQNPKYVKAYSRLGLAHYTLKNYEAAIEAYKKCVELEPKVGSHKDSLQLARDKLAERNGDASGDDVIDSSSRSGGKGANAGAASAAGLGAGGLAGMLKNPAIMKAAQDMMGGAGKGGIEQMMKNPAMMQMAQKMMQNPAMMQQAMSMLGGAGGGGGMPDMSALSGMMEGMGGLEGLGLGSGDEREVAPAPIPAPSQKSSGSASSSSSSRSSAASAVGSQQSEMENSDGFKDINDDPSMAHLMTKIKSGDIQGALKDAQANPALLQKMMKMMNEM